MNKFDNCKGGVYMDCCYSCDNSDCDRNGISCMIFYPAPITIHGKCSSYIGKEFLKYRLRLDGGDMNNLNYTCYLRKYRESHGLSQTALAFYLGTSQNTISNLECGVYRPNIELAFKIGLFFNCNPFDIFEFKEVEE